MNRSGSPACSSPGVAGRDKANFGDTDGLSMGERLAQVLSTWQEGGVCWVEYPLEVAAAGREPGSGASPRSSGVKNLALRADTALSEEDSDRLAETVRAAKEGGVSNVAVVQGDTFALQKGKDRKMELCFQPGRILLPGGEISVEQWACLACDQYTSQPDYWQEAAALAAGGPSALDIVLPEVYLDKVDTAARIETIHKTWSAAVKPCSPGRWRAISTWSAPCPAAGCARGFGAGGSGTIRLAARRVVRGAAHRGHGAQPHCAAPCGAPGACLKAPM